MKRFLVRAKRGVRNPETGKGVPKGWEGEMVLSDNFKGSISLEMLEDLGTAVKGGGIVPITDDKPKVESEIKEANADNLQKNTVIATNEGTEIVDSFPMGSNPNPALIKAKIAEVESSEPVVVEEGAGNPGGAKFTVEEKSRGWYNVVDTDSGAVMNDKSLRKDDVSW